MNEYTFSKLDIDKNHKAYHSKEITLRQGDKNGCEITATLYDHGQRITRTDLTAYFVMALPFGDYYYRKQATYNAGVMHVTIDESTAASVPGDTDIAYFELRKDTDLIATTEAIRVHIEPSALADKTPGETYDSKIEAAIADLNEATSGIPTAVQSATVEWLDAHPEATTTVQDGSINYGKLATDLKTAMVKTNLLPISGNGTVAVLGLSALFNDGVLTVSGTATGSGGRLNRIIGPFTLAAGTYTLSRSLDNATNLSIMLQNAANSTVLANAYNNTPATFTLDAETSVFVGINVVSGRTYDVNVNVQLEKGSNETPYVAPSIITAIDETARNLLEDYYAASVHKMDANDGLTNANDAEINRIYLLVNVSGVANLPTNKSGTLITLARHQMATVQLYCDASRVLYYRGNWGDLGWSTWQRLATSQDIPESAMPNVMLAYDNITCCGDSLTWGQVYTGATASRRAYVPYPAALQRIVGANVEQHAVPGYTAAQWWSAFNSTIQQKQNQLAIIFLGTNAGLTDTLETDAPSGSAASTWNTSTNTGAYARIVNDFKSVGAKVLLLRCFVSSGNLTITNQVIDQIASRFNCAAIDAPNLSGNEYHYWPNGLGTNAVHYNDLGYSAFADALANRVASLDDATLKLIIPE